MSFLDPAFLFSFLPITLLMFAIAGRLYGAAGSSAILILASVIFCIPYGWPFVILVMTSALVNHCAFIALVRPPNLERAGLRWRIFLGGLVFNFGVLFVLKYGVIFDAIPGATPLMAMIAAALPVTISFFTFQRSVMLFDAFQKRPEALAFSAATPTEQLQLGAFSLMFPNLIIGPIAYLSEIGPQVQKNIFGKLRMADLEVGLTIMTIGLGKKMLLADPLDARIVAPIFHAASAGQHVVPVEALMGMVAFYAQLYFDFSGYSDIAIGVARLFGLELPINFNSPLRASGIIDFWKRWHITLTRVIARLLFTPLAIAGTRYAMKHSLRAIASRAVTSWAPLLVNFAIIGVWHGAKWTYVIFGLTQGVWFILETEIRLTPNWKRFVKRTSDGFRLRAGQALMFVPLVVCFAIFRSQTPGAFWNLISSFRSDWLAPAGQLLVTRPCVIYLAVALTIIWLCPNVYEFLRETHPGILTWTVPSTTPRWMRLEWRPTLLWAAFALLMGLIVVGSLKLPTPFDYGGF
jgi:alginate O-acetyltransferase complex protein AlgI